MSSSVKFIIYFLLCFLGLNLFYQLIVIKQGSSLDFFTEFVANTTAYIYGLETQLNPIKPGIQILLNGQAVVNIMEGCNGLAVWFTLLSFVVAFGGKLKNLLWFIPVSFILLQIGNLLRLLALIKIKIAQPPFFNFFHTYAFPAILYAFAFGLMLIWIKLQAKDKHEEAQ